MVKHKVGLRIAVELGGKTHALLRRAVEGRIIKLQELRRIGGDRLEQSVQPRHVRKVGTK